MSNILYVKKGRIAYITFNRPHVLNAIDMDTFAEFGKIMASFEADDDVWVAVITGAGERAFSAGADLSNLPLPLPTLPPSIMRGINIRKPIIAAVNGIAFGGGFEIVLASDLVVAAEHARFGTPETKWGLMPGWGGTQRLPRIVPKVKASAMILLAESITAQEALQLGLVNKVVPLAGLMPAAEEYAQKITANGPMAVRAAKEAINHGLDKPLEDGLMLELILQQRLSETEDAREGINAFRSKSKPDYKAR